MSDKLRYWLRELLLMAAIGGAVLLFFNWMQGQRQRGHGGSLPVGLAAPDFSLRDVQSGAEVRLSAFKGRPVALVFWATYCGPCRSELPGIERVYRASEDRYGVLTLSPEGPGLLRDFVSERAFTFPVLSDPGGRVHGAYGVSTIPMTVILDRDGAVVHDFIGTADPDILRERLSALADGGSNGAP